MKPQLLACLVLASPLAARADAPAAAPAAKVELSQKDRDFAVHYFETTQAKFLESIKGVSEAQWSFKPSKERWSIGEVAEHIAVTESGIRGMIDGMLAAPAAPEKRAEIKVKDEEVVKGLSDRSHKIQAPEPFRPTHRFATRADLVKAFEEARAKNIATLKDPASDLRDHVGKSPMGMIDAYQGLLLIAAHSARHTAQLEEVKADPKFPKE